jgi:hypothetical protein
MVSGQNILNTNRIIPSTIIAAIESHVYMVMSLKIPEYKI